MRNRVTFGTSIRTITRLRHETTILSHVPCLLSQSIAYPLCLSPEASAR